MYRFRRYYAAVPARYKVDCAVSAALASLSLPNVVALEISLEGIAFANPKLAA
jgi:hypothetical protein